VDPLRTIKTYEFSSCDSAPTTDTTELAAIEVFRRQLRDRYFNETREGLFAANHEESADNSGLRQYEGPFYTYVVPRKPEQRESAEGVDWVATLYLGAARVRTRSNGADWGEWQTVRTRNFRENGRTSDGLGRWKCIVGAEIAWADVVRRNGSWEVTPAAAGVYEAEELPRALPVPTTDEISGSAPVGAVRLGSGSPRP
jgi:hypothetical protein